MESQSAALKIPDDSTDFRAAARNIYGAGARVDGSCRSARIVKG